MGILLDRILDPQKRPTVIADCAALVDAEVAARKGMTGMIIRTGYKTFKAIKPGIVTAAVDVLLDDFAARLDGQYAQYQSSVPSGKPDFVEWSTQRKVEIADDLLQVTDAIMEKSQKVALKKIYAGLRGIARANVAQSVPAVARMVLKSVD